MPAERELPATVVLSLRVRPGREEEYRRWQAEMTERCRAFPGFEASEVATPVTGSQDETVVVFRFDSFERLEAWLRSEVRLEHLARGAPLFDGPARQHVIAGSRAGTRGAGMVVSTRVKPGREAEHRAWQRLIDAEAARFPGFLGNEVFPPIPGLQEDWVVVVRFDTTTHLDAWLASDERTRLVEAAAQLWEEARVDRAGSGFPGWFAPGTAAERRGLPPSWKQAMTVLLVLYPTVMLIGLLFGPRLSRGPRALTVFASNALSVAVLTWLLMPLATRALSRWLAPRGTDGFRAELLGAGAVLLGYAAAIAAFLAMGL